MAVESGMISNFNGLVTLILTLGTCARTNGRTFETGFIKSTVSKSRPKRWDRQTDGHQTVITLSLPLDAASVIISVYLLRGRTLNDAVVSTTAVQCNLTRP